MSQRGMSSYWESQLLGTSPMEADLSGGEEKSRCSVRFASRAELILSASDLPPPGAELSDNQTFSLRTLDRDIFAIDAAVAAVSLTKKSYEPKRLDVERKHDKTFSPQHHIPPEIWSVIFLHGHLLDSDEDPFDWPTRTIWHLSQVCQTWRNLALSLHSCWSSIILELPLQWKASEMDVELLAFILERSHQHLLDITIADRILGCSDPDELEVQYCMRDMVFAECHRWRTARLVGYHRVQSDELYAPLRGRMPFLGQLELEFLGCMNDKTVLSAFKDCPRLVNVSFTGANPRMVDLPVKQITSLRLSDLSSQSCAYSVELLGQCTLLRSVHVDFAGEQEQALFAQSPRSIALPRLRELSATFPLFLDALTLPQLEVAALDRKTTHLHPDTLFSFYSLIQRSDCASNLTELRIMRVPLARHPSEPHLLLSVLSQTTRLATLQLEVSMYDFQQNLPSDEWSIAQIMDVMRALEVVPVTDNGFLPRLGSLDLEVTGHTDLAYIPYLKPFDDFVCMLLARRLEKFSFSLRTCYDGNLQPVMNYSDGTVFDEYERSVLRGLVGDGMSLDIHFEGVLCFDL